jgi:GxxExxY protein
MDAKVEETASTIVDSAIKVHKALGPGLLESTYQKCLAYELQKRGVQVGSEIAVPVVYDGFQIDVGFRLDMLVNDCVVVENKAVEQLLPIHTAQLLTYLRLGGYRLGFLLNWNVTRMKNGIQRIALYNPLCFLVNPLVSFVFQSF